MDLSLSAPRLSGLAVLESLFQLLCKNTAELPVRKPTIRQGPKKNQLRANPNTSLSATPLFSALLSRGMVSQFLLGHVGMGDCYCFNVRWPLSLLQTQDNHHPPPPM